MRLFTTKDYNTRVRAFVKNTVKYMITKQKIDNEI